MPAFTVDGKTYQNPVELVLDKLGGRWKMPILWRLNQRVWRYGELRRDLAGVSPKMLTQQLRELESDGFLTRTVYAEVPPRVDYGITARGRRTMTAIESLRELGTYLKRSFASTNLE